MKALVVGNQEAVLGFFIGQVMRATRGQANVHVVRKLLQEELDKYKNKE